MTGATGFVGRYMRAALAERWPTAIVSSLGAKDEAGDGVTAIDLLDRDGVHAAVAAAQPDLVIHLAAQASVAKSISADGQTWDVNVTGSVNLATATAAHAPEATVLFVSSSEVYGASYMAGMASEATPLAPLSAYGKSKAAAERLLAEILPPRARLIVARPCNHTGVGQRTAFVLPLFAEQIALMEAGRKPPRLEVGNIDVAREFLDVRDVVDAYIALIDTAPRLPGRFTCNIASGDARPLRERVEFMREQAKVRFEIVVDPGRLRPFDLPVVACDASLLRAVTGWAPRRDMRTTLVELLEAARMQQREPGRL